MKITISQKNTEIPHIINGISANTMFYLINYDRIFRNKEFDKNNTCCISTPYDKDDFSRIYNAYTAFEWNVEDIESAFKTAREIKAGRKIEAFIARFAELASLYTEGRYAEFDDILDSINYNADYQHDRGEFSIDLSKLNI